MIPMRPVDSFLPMLFIDPRCRTVNSLLVFAAHSSAAVYLRMPLPLDQVEAHTAMAGSVGS